MSQTIQSRPTALSSIGGAPGSSSFGMPSSQYRAHPATSMCNTSRQPARTSRKSSTAPTSATSPPPPNTTASNRASRMPSRAATTIAAMNVRTTATPPMRGTGRSCELRSFGTSNRRRRSARRMATQVNRNDATAANGHNQ